MKIKINSHILVFVAGVLYFLSVSVISVKAALVIDGGPHFEDIDAISLTIKYPAKASVLKEPYWNDLKTQFEHTLKEAEFNVSPDGKVTHSKTGVELIVGVELLKVPDANLFAVRIETAMARQMLLATGSDQIFIVPLSLGQRGIKFVSEDELPDFIENAASEHIDEFLRNYRATKSLLEKKDAQTEHVVTDVNQPTQVIQQTQVPKYVYIASNNSSVFHKPECRWAKNISQNNLVGYKSRDEAIKAGKRPCRSCNP
jgi:hypothetical protein